MLVLLVCCCCGSREKSSIVILSRFEPEEIGYADWVCPECIYLEWGGVHGAVEEVGGVVGSNLTEWADVGHCWIDTVGVAFQENAETGS